MDRSLEKKIVVVTGANGALGSVVRRRLEQAGATPAGIDLKADASGGVLAADLTDAASTQKAVDQILARHGRIDALLNIAGGFRMAPASDAAAWAAMWQMNLVTALNATRAVLPSMTQRGAGAIVSVAARAGAQPAGAQMGAYAASKAAVIRLTEALASEVKDQGVRVNCVLPSILDTEANRGAMPGADFGAWVRPEALADVLLFLCSDAAAAIHGAAIPVYGRA
jgi:NAD(P)-dependent dehydrogenase (short-subunit alcohol dehydrogenase family)